MLRNLMAAIRLALLALASTSALGSEIEVVVDQYQLDGSEQNNLIHSARSLGQTCLVAIPGTLAAIEMSLYSWYTDPADKLIIEILDASSGLAGAPLLGTTTISDAELGPSPQFLDLQTVTATLIDVSSMEISVSVGDLIGIRLSSAVELPAAFYVKNSFSNPYPRGGFFSNDSYWEYHDLAFKTFVAITQIYADGFESGDTSAWSSTKP